MPWVGESPEELWDEFSEAFGPIVVLLRSLDDRARGAFRDELDRAASREQARGRRRRPDRRYLLVSEARAASVTTASSASLTSLSASSLCSRRTCV